MTKKALPPMSEALLIKTTNEMIDRALFGMDKTAIDKSRKIIRELGKKLTDMALDGTVELMILETSCFSILRLEDASPYVLLTESIQKKYGLNFTTAMFGFFMLNYRMDELMKKEANAKLDAIVEKSSDTPQD